MQYFSISLVVFAAVVCLVTCRDDNPDDIQQICDSNLDVECLKEYFKKNGNCSVVEEPNDTPIYELHLPIYLPILNISAVVQKNYLSQLEGEVKAAYLDNANGNLVISINFEGLKIYAPDTIFAISRDGLEPKVFTEYVNCTYPAQLTAVLPVSDGLTKESLKKGFFSAYFHDSNANIILGPKFTESNDPMVQKVLEELLNNVGRSLQEIFRTKAMYYSLAYLQNKICDFGVPPVLKEYDLTTLSKGINMDTAEESEFSDICSDKSDMKKCVRDYFADNGSCSVVSDVSDDSVTRDMFLAFVPVLNLTAITNNAEISGLDGNIKKFYMNKKTGNLVLNVEFEAIMLDTPKLDLIIDEKAQQPKAISGQATCKYPVSLTAVLPIGDKITAETLAQSYISAYFQKPSVTIDLGSNFKNNDDPQAKTIVNSVRSEPTKLAQELFQVEAYGMFLIYLQKYICNFNIPISL